MMMRDDYEDEDDSNFFTRPSNFTTSIITSEADENDEVDEEDEELVDFISISKSKVNCVIDYLEIDNNKISMDLEFDFEFELK